MTINRSNFLRIAGLSAVRCESERRVIQTPPKAGSRRLRSPGSEALKGNAVGFVVDVSKLDEPNEIYQTCIKAFHTFHNMPSIRNRDMSEVDMERYL